MWIGVIAVVVSVAHVTSTAAQPGSTAAVVDGDVITLDRVDAEVARAHVLRIDELGDPAQGDWLAAARSAALNDLIDQALLVRAAVRAGLAIPSHEVDAAVAAAARTNHLTVRQLADAMAKQGVSLGAFRRQIREQLLAWRYVGHEVGLVAGETSDQARRRVVAQLRSIAQVSIYLPAPPPPLDASLLLTTADLASQLRRTLPRFERARLGDEPPSATYDSVHHRAVGRPERYDVAVRVWRRSPAELDTRWSELLPLATRTGRELGDASFRARDAGIRGIGVLDRAAGVTFLITCGVALCRTDAELLGLARRVHGRIGALATTPSASPP